MSEDSQVPDNFSTFLKRATKDWAQQAPVQEETAEEAGVEAGAAAGAPPAPVAPPAAPAVEPDLRIRLVSYLADNGPTPIAQVQSQFGIGFKEVGSALAKLEDAGLINVTGDPGGEVVELTPQGVKLA